MAGPSDAAPFPTKNTDYRHYFSIYHTDGSLITEWAIPDSERSLDGASFADCTNEAVEIGASGAGYIELTAAEMNTTATILKVSVGNAGAVPHVKTLLPYASNDIPASTSELSSRTKAADDYFDPETDTVTAKSYSKFPQHFPDILYP